MEWTKLSQGFPEPEELVLVRVEGKKLPMFARYMGERRWYVYGERFRRVLAWLRVPEYEE